MKALDNIIYLQFVLKSLFVLWFDHFLDSWFLENLRHQNDILRLADL